MPETCYSCSQRAWALPTCRCNRAPPCPQVWIAGGCGLAAALAQLAWVVTAQRREARLASALQAAGVCDQRQPELQEALLSGGSEAVREYLEP